MADDKKENVDPKAEYQANLDSAFEEVIGDLENTRDVLKGKIDEIRDGIKAELAKPQEKQ